MKSRLSLLMVLVAAWLVTCAHAEENLIQNGHFERRLGNGIPEGFAISGAVEARYLGDPRRDMSAWGLALQSAKSSGEVTCVVKNIDSSKGRWFRFAFRGLPQAQFAVGENDLYMKIAYFGDHGRVSYDAKEKRIYDQIETARRDLTVNGVRHAHGAEVWRTYQLDFMLPFPQVDELRLSVGFGHGAASSATNSEFFVDDLSLTRIPEPVGASTHATTRPGAVVPSANLIALGGRWFYEPLAGESKAPAQFDAFNVDRLLYHDDVYSAPFSGNVSAWLRAGDMDLDGNVVKQDRLVVDNVTIEFNSEEMVIHTHGIPNHPTGRFPELGFGNPNYIQEQQNTYYIPLNPVENPNHIITTKDNSNHALPMGPIGIAVNGVVFFNPFDMGNQDATDLMDRCCGHPNQFGQYHYHKYPICVNSPWADDGKSHSPVIGWAFDGYPIYGPYEGAGVMAKDLKGEHALNGFNMHYDEQRGWHYHVTPGQFPYLIGGYWGFEDPHDMRRPPRRFNANFQSGPGGFPPPRKGNPPPDGPP